MDHFWVSIFWGIPEELVFSLYMVLILSLHVSKWDTNIWLFVHMVSEIWEPYILSLLWSNGPKTKLHVTDIYHREYPTSRIPQIVSNVSLLEWLLYQVLNQCSSTKELSISSCRWDRPWLLKSFLFSIQYHTILPFWVLPNFGSRKSSSPTFKVVQDQL